MDAASGASPALAGRPDGFAATLAGNEKLNVAP